ncbi:MAG: WbqC family protein [Bacteroidota bacterium]
MKTLVCPVIPFPNIYWWSHVMAAENILLDKSEHFEKMSFRNRYMVSGSVAAITLSIPIREGRQQRKPMHEVMIDYATDWQTQHWRTLQSVYNRSPYFEFFAPDIQSLYQQKEQSLTAFNEASIRTIARLLDKKLNLDEAREYHKNYPADVIDIRVDFRSNQYNIHPEKFPPYHQVFEDRLGFLPNLSILDLLFAEGKNSIAFLCKE